MSRLLSFEAHVERGRQERLRSVAPFIRRLRRAGCASAARLTLDDVRDACRHLRARTTPEERAELVRLLDDLKRMTPAERKAAAAFRAMVTGEAS